MIDALILPPLRAALEVPARAFAARGVGADQMTLAGFAVGLLALPALWLGWFWLALVLILANRVADGLDGIMARKAGATDRGAFLDIALDFFFYATVPLGFALADPANALAAAVLICAFVGTGSSFLAFAVIAAKRGMTAEVYPTKGIYYLGGLTEGTETIVLFVVMCLFPAWFVPLAYAFAAACLLTTFLRWHAGWRSFSDL
ncbi:Phosphatidylglycerophosphate synthase [Pseudorhodobacter antarcticus]|jgi:phosphatidylglycerophosphate synthase|uniref:Phosphatidylglycerophosphate synthase n=1 Tax=Pseudorhodobacter antarcticus TaxID=1077947 RepID=A0A1H8INM6_9RHOB|nr:CDP-alcohol phosphatidyltransferase family protein [Pseudorhodobacter antarcticus]SEN70550.1 Phosphatidylglycerophosphate synthase [Pseudorhodobacter antarcticus]